MTAVGPTTDEYTGAQSLEAAPAVRDSSIARHPEPNGRVPVDVRD